MTSQLGSYLSYSRNKLSINLKGLLFTKKAATFYPGIGSQKNLGTKGKYLYSTKKNPNALSIGIRREDKNIWERRSPLTPDDVKRLINETGTKVFIQPSTNRVYNDLAYEKVGAVVSEDLSVSDIIMGIKEVPISKLIPNKTYAMFSHTHKGQLYNANLLQSFIDKNIRIVDYELIRDPKTGSRLVMFGKYAGYAGMIDGIHGLGQRMLAMGYNSPFINVGMAHVHPSLHSVKTHLKELGDLIIENGVPKDFGPVIFTITGSGNVAKGAIEIFECLPHEYIEPENLESFIKGYDGSFKYLNKVFGVKVSAKDYAYRISDGKFDYNEYKTNPELYASNFHEKIAPHTTVLAHGIFWNSKYPRLLTKEQAKKIKQSRNGRFKLITISDISCDIEGSIEFTNKASIIDKPFFYYDPLTDEYHEDIKKDGIQIMSIDNLPTELPAESSSNFSKLLYPVALEMVKNNFDNEILKNSLIAENKKLMPEHEHLYEILEDAKKNSSRITVIDNSLKKVLLAGSGMVTAPFIKYLENQGNIEVVIASNNRKEAESLASNFKYTKVYDLDASNSEKVDSLVADSDIVVNDIKDRGGKIKSFISWCGGLPAAENGNNPLGYKFSWSPRGVLTAGLNPAKYKLDNKIVEIEGSFSFEGLANRDSLSYVDVYGLDLQELDSMLRGTLRFKGYSELMDCFSSFGLTGSELNSNEKPLVAPTVLDAFGTILQKNMYYKPTERDMVVLNHEFIAEFPSNEFELHKSSLVSYGTLDSKTARGETAMARTVGIPAAIATKIILEKPTTAKGVLRPTIKEFYVPIMKRLGQLGPEDSINFVEVLEKHTPKTIYSNSIVSKI
ncbi:Alpha-aminoadipic semialdehyde synthase, mitochondrial [Smittium culicis]|uniref:Alpha-aminoadipic semialdehyde synthase, mitochondrial n=1 Tax=Smittium culicis TaxID=133412 RepID=A0A1R1X5S1_9FUNG|nr:Alpha-aminoadipic semialdehyde synthase, mitochondrial [Smittium culicis]